MVPFYIGGSCIHSRCFHFYTVGHLSFFFHLNNWLSRGAPVEVFQGRRKQKCRSLGGVSRNTFTHRKASITRDRRHYQGGHSRQCRWSVDTTMKLGRTRHFTLHSLFFGVSMPGRVPPRTGDTWVFYSLCGSPGKSHQPPPPGRPCPWGRDVWPVGGSVGGVAQSLGHHHRRRQQEGQAGLQGPGRVHRAGLDGCDLVICPP